MPHHCWQISHLCWHAGIEEVAICPVLDTMSPWITPVVENLAAEDMAPDAPIVLIPFGFEIMAAGHQIVEVGHLECRVMEFGRYCRANR